MHVESSLTETWRDSSPNLNLNTAWKLGPGKAWAEIQPRTQCQSTFSRRLPRSGTASAVYALKIENTIRTRSQPPFEFSPRHFDQNGLPGTGAVQRSSKLLIRSPFPKRLPDTALSRSKQSVQTQPELTNSCSFLSSRMMRRTQDTWLSRMFRSIRSVLSNSEVVPSNLATGARGQVLQKSAAQARLNFL